MKTRQTYTCKEDSICIQYLHNQQGHIVELREIDSTSPLENGECILPKVEVTGDYFFKIINNSKLK